MLNFKLKLKVAKQKMKVPTAFCCPHYLAVHPPVCCSGIQIMVNEHTGTVRVVLIRKGNKRSCD
jgi:hypothetical protein